MKKKLVGIFIIIFMIITIISPNAFAEYEGIDTTIGITDNDVTRSSIDITERIVGTLQVAGTSISIIALIIIGMRYMFSSVNDRAKMKGVIGHYVIGCILVFSTSNVLGFVYSIIDDVRHIWSDPIRVEPTCTRTGSITIECEDCGIIKTETLEALGHSYGSWTTYNAPTCTTAEVKRRTCTRCRRY